MLKRCMKEGEYINKYIPQYKKTIFISRFFFFSFTYQSIKLGKSVYIYKKKNKENSYYATINTMYTYHTYSLFAQVSSAETESDNLRMCAQITNLSMMMCNSRNVQICNLRVTYTLHNEGLLGS